MNRNLEQIYAKIRGFYGPGIPLVPGEGTPGGVMLVGEAPGKDEVAQGRPFCGKAGKNLDEFLRVLELERGGIYISNVCKFRPFKVSEKGTVSNRPPTREEILAARPFLLEEVRAADPTLLVTLGNTPLRALSGDFSAAIGYCHGRVTKAEIAGKPFALFALYHPASIIYNRALAEVYRGDLLKLKEYLFTGNR